MEIINKSLTPNDRYFANYDIKMDKSLNFNLLEDFCNIKEAEYFNLDLYNDDENIASWESSKSQTINDFLNECKASNINIKENLYWDLLIGIDGEDVNIGYEGFDGIYLNMEGTMKCIEKVLSIIEKIDKKDNIIKVMK